MSRFARNRRVYFVEEPIFENRDEAVMQAVTCPQTGVVVATPMLPESYRDRDIHAVLRAMLNAFVTEQKLHRYVAWFYTPMALDYAGDLNPEVTVYDCMDELSLFRGAPARLVENEKELLGQADLVFTGGVSLFEAKCKTCDKNIYPFPSGVDVPWVAAGRLRL